MDTQDRTTYQSHEFFSNPTAEQALIGSALLDSRVAAQCHWVEADWFTNSVYRDAWRICLDLIQQHQEFDHITVLDRMGADFEIENVLIQAIARPDIASPLAPSYAEAVCNQAKRRMLTDMAYTASQAAARGQVQAGMESILQRIAKLVTMGVPTQRTSISYRQLIEQLDEDVDARQHGDFRGLRTGFALVDKTISSMEPGVLIQIAGRPGCGKSALGLSIGRRVAGWLKAQGKGGAVEIITMEMSALAQARRLIALRAQGRISSSQMRRGFLNNVDEIDTRSWNIFQEALKQEISAAGDTLFFTDRAISTRELSLRLSTAKAERNMRLAIIDQLDLFTDPGKHGETERIGEVSRELKQIARNLGIVIICLCQLNRNVEGRPDHRPALADMRQSGRIEQDADIVLGLYRPSYYREMQDGDPPWYLEYAEAMVLKNRDEESPICIPLRFIPTAASYDDWPDEFRDAPGVIAKMEGRR